MRRYLAAFGCVPYRRLDRSGPSTGTLFDARGGFDGAGATPAWCGRTWRAEVRRRPEFIPGGGL